ncbi:hypothetical protein [Methylocystis sp.]|uniref:hypothetical protein n=1 Tax=Methylocystis sp. TaxID=1911079 RepID=UPI002732FEF7|nr:hypothetical protein [Methylocystis sp.]MDP3554839.1 hypothetical protein [Methylocystis sp.]
MSDDEDEGKSGVSGGSPSTLFEMSDEDERAFEDSNPFPEIVRRGGSRRGVPNRRTDDVKRYYQALGFRDPLAFLGHLITIDTAALASALSCKKAVAVDVQRKAATDLMPYLYSKQPAKLDLGDGEALPMLVIGRAERQAVRKAVAAGSMSIDGDFDDGEENQPVADGDAAGSHGDGSHGDGEAK